jgi:BASS family bile acid:Na+ symporter
MALVAGWWGIWDIIAGLIVAALWARHTRRRTGSPKGDASRHAAGRQPDASSSGTAGSPA